MTNDLGNEPRGRDMPLSQLLFSFQGRLNRKPYWMTALATVVIIVLLIMFALIMFGEHDFWAGGSLLAVLVILYIPLIWISLALRSEERRVGKGVELGGWRWLKKRSR